MYSSNDVEWLRHVLMKLKASGMLLRDIRRYADLVRTGSDDGNLAERLELMKQQRGRLTEQIAELNSCLELVEYKIGLYSRSLP
jgi:DNA-binding transcriptional MerR regulator